MVLNDNEHEYNHISRFVSHITFIYVLNITILSHFLMSLMDDINLRNVTHRQESRS